MEHTFEALGLRAALVTALAEQGITAPRKSNRKMIPEILSGKDVIGRSETGSGKTLAYLLPIFEKLDMNIRGTQAIILTPTPRAGGAGLSSGGAFAGKCGHRGRLCPSHRCGRHRQTVGKAESKAAYRGRLCRAYFGFDSQEKNTGTSRQNHRLDEGRPPYG